MLVKNLFFVAILGAAQLGASLPPARGNSNLLARRTLNVEQASFIAPPTASYQHSTLHKRNPELTHAEAMQRALHHEDAAAQFKVGSYGHESNKMQAAHWLASKLPQGQSKTDMLEKKTFHQENARLAMDGKHGEVRQRYAARGTHI